MAGEVPIAAVVLAAGFSRRLGRPKQTVVLAGETLVERAARTAREAGLNPVVVVTNAEVAGDPALSRPAANGCHVLTNSHAAEGMASSIRCGVAALASRDVQGAILMTCDQVAATAGHLRLLFEKPEEICGSAYAGRVGVPAYFPRNSFGELEKLRGDQGARELLRGARVVPLEDLALDVDSESDLQRVEEWLRKRG